MVGAVVALAKRHKSLSDNSLVAKMHKMNLLPGGPESKPAQEALRIKHADAEAEKAQQQAKSFTPAMPGSHPVVVREVGMDAPAAPAAPPQEAEVARPIKINLPKPPTRVETEPRPAPEAQDEVEAEYPDGGDEDRGPGRDHAGPAQGL